MKRGKYFEIPEGIIELGVIWDEADKLAGDEMPDWTLEDNRWIRGLGATSWAYIPQKEQGQYFDELDELGKAGIIVDGDDGDGCVNHLYIENPRSE